MATSNLQNQPPSTPVAAATRPPPDSTDAQKDEAVRTVRKARWVAQLRKPEEYKDPESEQTVAVMVNNGAHGGFRAIGRYFPNGLTQGVKVSDEELAELKAEPQDLIRVVDASEVASLSGKGASGSSTALSADEQTVLADFRSSGQDAATYLGRAQQTGTGTSSSDGSSSPSSKASGDEPVTSYSSKRK